VAESIARVPPPAPVGWVTSARVDTTRLWLRVIAPAGELPGVPADGEVLVGVRPEHARPWAEEAGLIGPLEGVVEYAEALGRETFLGVRRDGGPRLVVCVEGRSGAQPGDRVTYGLVPGGLRYFDPQTGDAVATPR
jgi:ABC-type sugar transport system ATPase subunit